MTIFSLYILSKSGGLIYQHDHNLPTIENEKTFSFPLELKLDVQNRNVVVSFGQRDGIKGNNLAAKDRPYLTFFVEIANHHS